MDLDAAHRILVEGVEANGEHGFVDLRSGALVCWELEADEPVVDACREVGARGEAGGRDVGSWYAELEELWSAM